MTTSTETLIVELQANVSNVELSLAKVESSLSGLDTSVTKTDSSFKKLASSAGKAASAAITTLAAAGTAASAALLAATNAASQYSIAIEVAANRSRMSVEGLQEMAYATKTVGIDLEKLGDISKDTNEKIGEFIADGTGGFNDFVSVANLTKDEAYQMAQAFQYMSGPEVLQAMVTEMEAAGASANEMSFALEGVASDTTDLIPLLENGGEAMADLRDEARKNIKILTEQDLANIGKVAEKMQQITEESASNSRKLVSVLSDDITRILDGLSGATALIGESIIWAINGVQILTTQTVGNVMNLTREAEMALLKMRITFNELTGDDEEATFLKGELEALQALDLAMDEFDTSFFNEQMEKAREQISLFRGEAGLGEEGDEKLEETVEKNEEAAERMSQAWQDYYAGLADDSKKQTKDKKKDDKDKEKAEDSYYGNATALAQQFAGDNDAVSKALIIADTAAAITKSLKVNPYDWVNPALIAATGAAQLAAVGSGSSSGSTGGGGGGSQQQQHFVDNTESVQVSGTIVTSEGTTESSVAMPNEDDMARAMWGIIKMAQDNGSIA